ncbi:hypothetical protein X801_01530, partial [Opisthorchis viverrini]
HVGFARNDILHGVALLGIIFVTSVTERATRKSAAWRLPQSEEETTTRIRNRSDCSANLDLVNAYLQFPVTENSRGYLTINTHLGLFKHNQLQFGVETAPAAFQQIMDTLLHEIPGIAVYLDDALIMGLDPSYSLCILENFFLRLKEAGFHLRVEKCNFSIESVEFLGFISKNLTEVLILTILKISDRWCLQKLLYNFAYFLASSVTIGFFCQALIEQERNKSAKQMLCLTSTNHIQRKLITVIPTVKFESEVHQIPNECVRRSPVTTETIRITTRNEEILLEVMDYIQTKWSNGEISPKPRPFPNRLGNRPQNACLDRNLERIRIIFDPRVRTQEVQQMIQTNRLRKFHTGDTVYSTNFPGPEKVSSDTVLGGKGNVIYEINVGNENWTTTISQLRPDHMQTQYRQEAENS